MYCYYIFYVLIYIEIMASRRTTCKTPRCNRYTRLNPDGYCPACAVNQAKLVEDDTPYPCAKCSKNCSDTNSCVQCELCFEWSHTVCLGISDECYKLLKTLSGSRWFCSGCDNKLDTIMEKAISLEVETKVNKIK